MPRIAIVSVPVSDQARAKEFYSKVLGFQLLRDEPMGPEQQWVQLAPQRGTATLALVTWFEEMPPGSLQGMVLESSDVKAEHERLKEKGLDISDLTEAPWGTYATFSDPDGNGWVLQQTNVGE